MIRLQWSPEASEADIVIESDTIQLDDGLESAVIISLFSDARARDDDDMAGASKDRRGWWGDTYADNPGTQIGSRLWLRRRNSVNNRLLADVQADAQDALQWLVDDGVASAVNVATERFGVNGVRLSVEIVRPSAISPRWFRTWEMYRNGI